MNAVNLLIVDDHPLWASIAAGVLRPVASRIQFSPTWDDALSKIKRPDAPDVVMLNLNLPDSPAREVTERVNYIKNAGPKVVVLSPAPVEEGSLPPFCEADGVIYKGDIDMAEKLAAVFQ